MENKKKMMDNMLGDDELVAVTGGTKYRRMNAWAPACDEYYVCQMCGSTSPYLNGHNPGCTVPAIVRPEYALQGFGQFTAKSNGCWSCKHVVYGDGYPADERDLWCPKTQL